MQSDPEEKSSLESYLSADRPINSKKEDGLKRARFSEALAKVIQGWRKKPSLVIGLYGEWGSGKSSIKNMLIETLNAEGTQPLSIVEFSPWQVSGQDLLAENFLREVGKALGKSAAPDEVALKKRIARWKVYSACLSIAASVARTWKAAQNSAPPSPLQPIAEATSIALDSAAAVVKTGAEGIEADGTLETMSLTELKDAVSEDLSQLDTPILVILDDVDRLTKEEIRLTLQLVKANADFPNLIYLILAQKDIVVKALDEIAPGRGDIFLEKIVQVPFDVPTVNRKQLQDLFLKGLNDLLLHPSLTSRFDKTYWSRLFPEIFPLFRNIRDINRFLGSLAFHIELFRNGDTFEVNPVDLIALEALRVFENGLYSRLASDKEILTYEARWFRENKRDEDKLRLQELLAKATLERRTSIEKIIGEIFPPVETVSQRLQAGVGTGASIDAAEQRWFKQLRVCSYQAFDRYFQFETPEGDVSQADIDDLTNHMSDQKALNAIFESLAQRDLLDVMLTRLHSLKESFELDNASTFLAALFEIQPIHKLYSFLEPSPERNIMGITYWYLQRLSESERLKTLQDAIEKTTGIGFATRTIALLASEPRGGETSAPFLSSETDREALKASCLKKIQELAAGDYELEPHGFRMLRIWAAWDANTARAWVLAYIGTRDRLVRFLNSSVHLSGEPPTAKPYISLEAIEPMLSRDQLQARIDELLHEGLSEKETELVGMVDAAKKRGPLEPGVDPVQSDEDD
jgi:predicted KAP-like P-loop ATPase